MFNTESEKARVDWWLENFECYGNVYNIITGSETWNYCYDPLSNQQSTQQIFQNEMEPIKVKQSRNCAEQMIVCVVSRTGSLCFVIFDNMKTVTADWCTNYWLTHNVGTTSEKANYVAPRKCFSIFCNVDKRISLVCWNKINIM